MNGRISLDTNIVIRLFKNDPAVIKMLADLSIVYLPVPCGGRDSIYSKKLISTNKKPKNLQ